MDLNYGVKMAVVSSTGSYAKWGGLKMFLSAVALAVSSALMLFYMQTICEKAMKREFSRPYFKQIIQAFQLEYPLLRDDSRAKGSFDFGCKVDEMRTSEHDRVNLRRAQ